MDIMEYIEVIKLYNRNIKRSQSFLYNVLGCILDQNLNGLNSVTQVFIKITSKIMSQRKHENNLNCHLYSMLFNALIEPQLDYTCTCNYLIYKICHVYQIYPKPTQENWSLKERANFLCNKTGVNAMYRNNKLVLNSAKILGVKFHPQSLMAIKLTSHRWYWETRHENELQGKHFFLA